MTATPFHLEEATVAHLSQALAAGTLTSEQLVLQYLARIAAYDKAGPTLNSVLEINPDAIQIAQALDEERKRTGPRGPLHGIPVLIKDNIDTGDKMHTSAGTLALANSFAPADAFIVTQLRQAGAIILGKANMTEFANFMTEGMPSGYSSRGGQVINPYLKDLTPSGSSAGSGVSVAASLTAVAVGTETSGSILSPANNNSVVGIKPTVGLVSRTGIIPIAMSQDTAGPMCRTVADAALLLGALTGVDPADPVTAASIGHAHADYTPFLQRDGLKGARIGVLRLYQEKLKDDERALFTQALDVMRSLGAEVIDPIAMPSVGEGHWDSNVLVYEFKPALNAYLATLGAGAPVKTLKDVIAFNDAHPEATLKYGQTLLTKAEATSGTLTEPEYLRDRIQDLNKARFEGIDAVMAEHQLDAIVYPFSSYGCWIPARAGHPSIQVPAGYTEDGRPMGITFTGTAWSEPTLIRLGYAFEQATHHRRPPTLG